MDERKFNPGNGFFEQLALGLNVDEETPSAAAGETFVSPEEARLRSEAARQLLAGLPGGKPWMEQYYKLLEAGWPWRVACYIAWAASPRIGRWPGTQQDLATLVLGLTSDRVIGTWRKKNQAIDDVITILQAAPLMQHRADVFAALALSASDTDHRSNPDRRLFLEMTNDYVPHSKIEVKRDAEDLTQLSDAELDELAGQILKKKTDE